MDFWKMAYDIGAIDAEYLKQAVKTPTKPYLFITPEEYKEITGIEFVEK